MHSSVRVWISIGAGLFLIALAGSAWMIPELLLLHTFQALIYVSVLILARYRSAWGFGAGFTIGVAWNSMSLFITHLIQAGVAEFWSFLRTGQVRQPDTMMVALGGLGHFILIFACMAAVINQRMDDKKWRKFLGGGLLSLAYFALIVAFARPH